MHSGQRLGGLYLTEDHPVRGKDGWYFARDIKVGMRIATGDPTPSLEQRELLTGMLLGDASMATCRKRALLRLTHSINQEEWFDRKLEALKGFTWTGRHYRKQPLGGIAISVNSRVSGGLNEIYRAWYPDGKKRINRTEVSACFSPMMLAAWYCDDGSLHVNKTKAGKETRPSAILYTNNFEHDDVEWLTQLLIDHGIDCHVVVNKRPRQSKPYPVIYIGVDGFERFISLVGPYVPPEMRYKLPKGAPEFDPSLWEEMTPALSFFDEVVVSEPRAYTTGHKTVQTTYHIGVEGTGSYIAAGMLVHNTTDNGAMFEIIGRGSPVGPIIGPAVGLAPLDSWLCDRTSNPEFPIVYTDTDGRRYKLHRTRVATLSQMPSAIAEMRNVGMCWLSRCVNTVQNLADIGVYKQEHLGSRPLRAMGIGRGIRKGLIQSALAQSNAVMDQRGLRRRAQIPFLEDVPTDAGIDLVDFASLPDGFDERQSTELGMFTIALAGGVPPRWLWPATTTGATKADAMYQHVAGIGGGAGATLRAVATLLGGSERGAKHSSGKFLPPHLRMVFDFQDDEQDRAHAQVAEIRSETRQRELLAGVITLRVARERALTAGDLSQAQFDQLELSEGRLPDGTDAIALFEKDDAELSPLLDIGVAEPLDVTANEPEATLLAIGGAERRVALVVLEAGTANEKRVAQQAGAALVRLRGLYEDEINRERMAPTLEAEDEEEDEEELEKEQKQGGGLGSYQRGINAAVRGLWSGAFDFGGFFEAMMSTITRGLTAAWAEGAAKCGIAPNELTLAELNARKAAIFSESNHINGFAEAIESGSKANGGKLSALSNRAGMWGNRYRDIVNRAQQMACKDKKLMWHLGPTVEHCVDCLKLDGRTYRASTWERWDVRPQSPALACKGILCLCEFQPTDVSANKGRPPKLSGQ